MAGHATLTLRSFLDMSRAHSVPHVKRMLRTRTTVKDTEVNGTWNVAHGWNMWEPFYRVKLDGVHFDAHVCYCADFMSFFAGNGDGFVCEGSFEQLESLEWC